MSVSMLSVIISGLLGGIGLLVDPIEKHFKRKSEEKISKNQIDADLVAKSRIKWIEAVRQHTVEFLNEYNNIKYFEYKDKKEIEQSKAYENCLKEINFLKLYFETDRESKTNIFNIHKELEAYYKYMNFSENKLEAEEIKQKSPENENLKKLKEKFLKEKNINEKALKRLYAKNNNGKNQYIIMFLNDLKENISFAGYPTVYIHEGLFNIEKDLKKSIWEDTITTKIIDKYVEDLNEIIGIYLKIEWDRAKTGK